MATGKPLGPPLVHGNEVTRGAWLPDGRRVVTGSVDGRVQFWEVPVPWPGDPERVRREVQLLTRITLDERGSIRAFTPDNWQRLRRALELERRLGSQGRGSD